MHVAVVFENIGGYHAARLLATYQMCQERGWQMTAIQITDQQGEHPWGKLSSIGFPVETVLTSFNPKLSRDEGLRRSGKLLRRLLSALRPDVVAIPGWGFDYARVALHWCRSSGACAVLMSESKRDDEKRAFWKEWLKKRLFVRYFSSAIVGAKSHKNYLTDLGMKDSRIFLGYDVVDNHYFAEAARQARTEREYDTPAISGHPPAPLLFSNDTADSTQKCRALDHGFCIVSKKN